MRLRRSVEWRGVTVAKTLRVLLALALLASSATGCAPAGARKSPPHRLTVSLGHGEPNSLNIHLDPSATVGYLSELTAAYLARYDRDGHPVPELATVIPTKRNGGISADGRTITFHLRRNARWSDGAPFSADDVVFSVRAILNPKNDEEQGTEGWDLIERMDEPDKYTVAFHLKKPYGDFLPMYFGTAADEPCILPKHLLGDLPDINTAAYNRLPVGIGPFRVVAWRRGDAIELEANPYYWRGKPKLQHITWKLVPSQETVAAQLRTGELDLWPLVPPNYLGRFQGDDNLRVLAQPSYRTTNLDFIVTRPHVADVRVRQAVRYALDRPRLIRDIVHGFGYVHDGIVLPLDPPGPNDPVTPYDPARARALLERAGWLSGPDGIRVKRGQRLVLTADYPAGSPDLDQTVEFVRSELLAVGIGLESRSYQPNVFHALQQNGGILYGGKFDFTIFARTLEAVSDAFGLYSCNTQPPNGENATRYCNPRVDAELQQIERSYDARTRKQLFREVQRQIVADSPTIVLYVWKGGYVWNRALTGFNPPILTPFDDMMNVDIK
jgi:peptide/nickel transport system substrate-binding protein